MSDQMVSAPKSWIKGKENLYPKALFHCLALTEDVKAILILGSNNPLSTLLLMFMLLPYTHNYHKPV